VYVVDDPTDSEIAQRPSHLWMLIFLVVVVSGAMVLYGLYSSNQYENQLATTLGAQFHGVLGEQDWQRLYTESDQGFKDKYNEDTAVEMFSSVSNQMGSPITSRVIGEHMKRAEDGSYLYATFETVFSNEQKAIEHITWHETYGIFKLSDYDVEPEAK
jgi:hypothetical protein